MKIDLTEWIKQGVYSIYLEGIEVLVKKKDMEIFEKILKKYGATEIKKFD